MLIHVSVFHKGTCAYAMFNHTYRGYREAFQKPIEGDRHHAIYKNCIAAGISMRHRPPCTGTGVAFSGWFARCTPRMDPESSRIHKLSWPQRLRTPQLIILSAMLPATKHNEFRLCQRCRLATGWFGVLRWFSFSSWHGCSWWFALDNPRVATGKKDEKRITVKKERTQTSPQASQPPKAVHMIFISG